MERSSPEKKRNGINEMFPKLHPGSGLQNIIEDYPTFPPFVKEGTWDSLTFRVSDKVSVKVKT